MKNKLITTINIILIVIAILTSMYLVITRDDQIGLILKDSAIIITITLPYILEKVFKIKIENSTKFFYILFVFMAHFLGVTIELYNKIYCFDKITHFLSGVVSAFGAFFVLVKAKKYDPKSVMFNVLYIIAITLMVASLWELFEYTANILVGGDAQRVALTGVNDTMQDIIVAFLGAILVSIAYCYECFSNKTIIVKQFINNVK